MEGTDFKHRYTVDQVPWYWWLPMEIYGWSLGLLWFLYVCVVNLTSRIRYPGEPLDSGSHYIYCFWHESIFAYMCLQLRFDRLCLFVHPVWYMRPSHIMGLLKGVSHTVYGSSGNRGKQAAARLTALVAGGQNTFFTPDGPEGPRYHVKKGALYVALDSNTPIVGMTIAPSRYIRLKHWDRKIIPLPFGRIDVSYGEPFHPAPESMDQCAQNLAAQMNGGAAALRQDGDKLF